MWLEFSSTILYLSFYVYLQFGFLSCFFTLDDKKKNLKKQKRRFGSDSCAYIVTCPVHGIYTVLK